MHSFISWPSVIYHLRSLRESRSGNYSNGAMNLMFNKCQMSLSTHLARIFLKTQETIKVDHISKQKFILFTTNAWTSPNYVAFMAVTTHYINAKFELKDLTIAVPHIQGQHTSEMFAEKFNEVLKTYQAKDKLFTITADNASTNNKMANHLCQKIPGFNNATCLLGCVVHVINLAAKAGILLLGSIEDE